MKFEDNINFFVSDQTAPDDVFNTAATVAIGTASAKCSMQKTGAIDWFSGGEK